MIFIVSIDSKVKNYNPFSNNDNRFFSKFMETDHEIPL